MGTGGGLVVIDFSEQGNSAHFRGDGWSGQEPDRVWGIGPRSVLRVPMQSSSSPFILEAELGPCHSLPKIIGQIVRLRVNGVAVGSIRLETLSQLRCTIDPVVARPDGLLVIEFESPGFYAPAGLVRCADRRPLSCWFSSVRVYTTDMFATGLHFPIIYPDIREIAWRRHWPMRIPYWRPRSIRLFRQAPKCRQGRMPARMPLPWPGGRSVNWNCRLPARRAPMGYASMRSR
jgi:hypothetical protein